MGLISAGFLLGLHFLFVTCDSRKVYLNAAGALKASIVKGKSLKGTSIKKLKPTSYNVASAGLVENFSEWPIKVEKYEEATGKTTLKLRNVLGGTQEAFANRKVGHTATGIWARYSLSIDNDLMIHLMYSIPYSHDFHSNYLAIMVCSKRGDKGCKDVTAKKMYYGKGKGLARNSYAKPTKVCSDALCVIGSIQKSHQPSIDFAVFPKSFYNLQMHVREKFWENYIGYEEYKKFMAVTFKNV